MSRADQIGAAMEKAFPGLRVTSTDRTRAEQDVLIRRGVTKAQDSQHLHGNGLDVVLPKNVSLRDAKDWLRQQNIEPGEFLNESGGANQGTGPHLHIGLAPKKGGGPVSADGGSTYDKVVARQRASTNETSLDGLFRARMIVGKPGGMTAKDAAAFDAAIAHGDIVGAPPWFKSAPSPRDVPFLPDHLLKAYNSHQMDDDAEARQQIERAVSTGDVRLKPGQTLQKPAPRTAGQIIGMGARNMAEGLGGLVDVVAGPANIVTNAVTGSNLSSHPATDLAGKASDALGLARPESGSEQLNSSIIQGGAQGLATAGLGTAASGLEGGVGLIGKALASNPVLDTISGATSGFTQETARQAGAGPVAQIAAGLAGGLTPVGLAGTAERMGARKLPDVVASTPRSAVIDEAGNLTPHGQEVATFHGVTPEEFHAAYEAPPAVKAGTGNDQMPEAVAKEATTGAPVEQALPERELPPQPNIPDQQQSAPDAAPVVPEALPATALDRVTQAKAFGVDMTRGQATKAFDVQDAESRLRNSNGPQSEDMRQFAAKQTDQVKAAVEKFKSGFGDSSLSAEDRGSIVTEAVRELRDNGKAGVAALYKQAKELGQAVPLEADGIRAAYDRLMVEAEVPQVIKDVMTQEMARHGLIGETVEIPGGGVTGENQITKVKLDNGDMVRFHGAPQPLALDNAEEFRKAISAQYPADGPRKLTSILKKAIDDATEAAAEKLALYGQEGAKVPQALKAARDAHVAQTKTFKAKDIIQSIVDWKKGVATDILKPEQVMERAFSTTSDLKRLKAVLLSGKTPKAVAAWRAIQAHGLALVFKKATQQNANIGGVITDAISGAKLRTSIEAFGVDKLKVLLDPEDFNTLMKLRRTIEDVTIPITGTTNPSGSGNLLMRLAKDADNQVTAAFSAAGFAVGGPVGAAVGGSVGRTIAPAIKSAKETAQAAETLKGVTDYTPATAAGDTGATPVSAARKAADATKQAGAKTVAAFIEIYSTPRVIAPVLVSTQQ